jgi:hypothetical protein
MPGLAECQSLLRLLIARGDPKAIPLAKGAIDQYLNTAPVCMRGRGLRVLQSDALDQVPRSACSARSPRRWMRIS